MAEERRSSESAELDRLGIHAAIGVLLGDARVAAGMPQSEVAKRLGVAQSRIAKLELGTRRLLYVEALQLAALYGLHVTAFDPSGPTQSTKAPRRPRVNRPRSTTSQTPVATE